MLRVPALLATIAAALYLLPGLLGPYGPFIDELYYVACAKRLAWGYVDHPPLAPFVLAISRGALGDSLLALRLPAAAAGGLLVFGTGALSARLGASRFGQATACGAVILAPVLQVLLGFYSMNALELVFWLGLSWVLVEIALRRDPRLWLAFGLVAGLALLNKHTVVTFALALAAATIVTPARRDLGTKWPWLGIAIAALLITPNIVWQVQHGWPSLEFYRNAALNKNQPISPFQVLAMQVLFMSPGTLPVTLAGLWYLLRRRDGADLRHLGLLFLILLALLMISGQSRPDRISGAYPLLFAAGGAMLEQWARTRRWVRLGAPAWLVSWGLLLMPIGIPILPPAATAAYGQALGAVPQIERGEGKRSALPQWFADRLGWDQLVSDVAEVRDRLPPADRGRVMFFAPSYGQAGALEWLGESRGLVPVYSTHNNYWFWGPPPTDPDVAIVIGNTRERLEQLFEQVDLGKIHECDGCMPWRNEMPIWVVRHPRGHIADHWTEWKHFE